MNCALVGSVKQQMPSLKAVEPLTPFPSSTFFCPSSRCCALPTPARQPTPAPTALTVGGQRLAGGRVGGAAHAGVNLLADLADARHLGARAGGRLLGLGNAGTGHGRRLGAAAADRLGDSRRWCLGQVAACRRGRRRGYRWRSSARAAGQSEQPSPLAVPRQPAAALSPARSCARLSRNSCSDRLFVLRKHSGGGRELLGGPSTKRG